MKITIFANFKTLTLAGLILFGFAMAAAPGSAKPKVSSSTKYYKISGSTFDQLKSQMKRKGPSGFWGYAKWDVRWNGRCQLKVKLSYTYPKWVNKSKAPKSMQQTWNRMISALKTHEKGHGQNGINAAREVEKRKCGSKSNAIMDKWLRQDKIYDAKTRHGKTQGVVLP